MREDDKKQKIMEVIYHYQQLRGKDMLQNLLVFGRVLKALGMKVTVSQVIEALDCLKHLDIADRRSLQTALQASFIQSRAEIEIFNLAFNAFWGTQVLVNHNQHAWQKEVKRYLPEGDWDEEEKGAWQPGYSPEPLWKEKDFTQLDQEEMAEIMRYLEQLAAKLTLKQSKRLKANKWGEVDWRKTIKKSLATGGDILKFKKRKPKRKKLKLIVFCDVSGSMEGYSKFLLQFIYILQRVLSPIEFFVFSTALAKVSHILQHANQEQVLLRLKEMDFDWAGGTNMGKSLQKFNLTYAPTVFTQQTVVVILSDGWERGEVQELVQQMQNIRKKAWKIIWLNPLADSPDYEPTCRGMAAALPFIDALLPFENLQSLENFVEKLTTLFDC
jgi:uncharacterized protein with von Willebrand factor type A (vWA) domain